MRLAACSLPTLAARTAAAAVAGTAGAPARAAGMACQASASVGPQLLASPGSFSATPHLLPWMQPTARCTAALGSAFGLLHSERARQRRLMTASAAAEPALAAAEGSADPLAWLDALEVPLLLKTARAAKPLPPPKQQQQQQQQQREVLAVPRRRRRVGSPQAGTDAILPAAPVAGAFPATVAAAVPLLQALNMHVQRGKRAEARVAGAPAVMRQQQLEQQQLEGQPGSQQELQQQQAQQQQPAGTAKAGPKRRQQPRAQQYVVGTDPIPGLSAQDLTDYASVIAVAQTLSEQAQRWEEQREAVRAGSDAPQPQEWQPQQQGQQGQQGGQEETFQLPVPNLGYTCMNMQLQQQFGIRTNRRCIKSTFDSGGLPVVSALALANCGDLLPLVEWNRQQGIHFFRIPSALFPWSQEYALEELPDFEEICATLAAVGAAARAAHQRLTAHPSHYVQLASPDDGLVGRSLQHLELNAQVFDLMGYSPCPTNKINIHVGGTYGNKQRSLDRFAAALDRLTPSCRVRITVENDDRPAHYSLAELQPLHRMTGTPLVFDYLHHALVPGGMGEEEALVAALDTWPTGVRPVVHYSEPSENPDLARRAHSCMLTQPFDLYGRDADVDVMLEAKGMERALVFYRDDLLLGRKKETTSWPTGHNGRQMGSMRSQNASRT